MMSTKSTITCLPCCHIYRDCIGSNGEETLCIDVSYGNVKCEGDYQDCIEVENDSDFAKLMRYLLKGKTDEELQAAIKAGL